jgi:hypothetical protein
MIGRVPMNRHTDPDPRCLPTGRFRSSKPPRNRTGARHSRSWHGRSPGSNRSRQCRNRRYNGCRTGRSAPHSSGDRRSHRCSNRGRARRIPYRHQNRMACRWIHGRYSRPGTGARTGRSCSSWSPNSCTGHRSVPAQGRTRPPRPAGDIRPRRISSPTCRPARTFRSWTHRNQDPYRSCRRRSDRAGR